MAARQQAGGGRAPGPFDFSDPGAPFDFSTLQNVLNDPGIKAMAEKLAQDPAFAHMTASMGSSLGPMGGQGPVAASGPEDGPVMDPTAAQQAMENMFQNPDFMNMAQELGQKIMQSDPGMQEMMTAMQRPDFQQTMNERLQKMKDDPEIANLMKDMEAQGPGAMMRYWNDPAVLEKMSSVMGDVFRSEEEAAAGDAGPAGDEDDGATPPLVAAASNGDVDEVKRLLGEGTDVDETDEEGRTALQFACGYGYKDCAEELLKAKASVNAVDYNKNTALHYAAGYGEAESVSLLLKHNVDRSVKNADGQTAEGVANLNQHPDICGLLKEE